MKHAFQLFFAAVALTYVAQAKAVTPPESRDVIIAVTDVFVPDSLTTQTESYVIVHGLFPNACYKWKTAEVNHKSDYVHEITSVANVLQGMCLQVLVPFSKDVKLGLLQRGQHMLKFVSNDGTYMEKKVEVR